VARRCV